jgi:hypothetical protein
MGDMRVICRYFLQINSTLYDVKNELGDLRTVFIIRSYPARGYSTNISHWILYDPATILNRDDFRYYSFGLPYGNAIRLSDVIMKCK